MSRLEAALADVLSALHELGARPALIGGFAVSARAEPRFTRDLDLAVAVEQDEEAERLVAGLVERGYRVGAVVEQLATARMATVRLTPPGEPAEGGVVVDLRFASSGVEEEIVAEAEPIEVFKGLEVPVARAGHLVALKLLARDDESRPQDAADLRALAPFVDDAEAARARAAVRLIASRGFARGRALEAALDAWIAATRG